MGSEVECLLILMLCLVKAGSFLYFCVCSRVAFWLCYAYLRFAFCTQSLAVSRNLELEFSFS